MFSGMHYHKLLKSVGFKLNVISVTSVIPVVRRLKKLFLMFLQILPFETLNGFLIKALFVR